MPKGELVPGDEDALAKAIRDAIGASTYERVEVTTPQFERTDGKTITYIPTTADELDGLKAKAPDWVLADIGMGKWDKLDDGRVHWLFPGEWYKAIPEGYPIVFIDGETGAFVPDTTDDDIRFGCLPYGWIRHEAPDGD